ncbi:MAG: alpha/beta hydrolase [Candidatus Thorarchaeota archaeon]
MVSLRMRLVIRTLRKNKEKPKEQSVTAYREGMDGIADMLPPLPDDIVVKPERVGHVGVEWISHRESETDSVIFYIHGGGYVSGNLAISRYFIAQFIQRTKIPFLIVDYGLSPEHPFPQGLDDATSIYEWLLKTRGVQSDNVVFFGESAGGGLVLSTLVNLRRKNLDLPAAAVCLSPWTDLADTGESMNSNVDIDPSLSPEETRFLAKQYIGDNDPKNPLISPLYAELHELPPLFIQVGTAEIILDDSLRLAEKAKMDGVEVTLDVWKDMPHVFTIYFQYAPESRKGIDRICEFITQHIE